MMAYSYLLTAKPVFLSNLNPSPSRCHCNCNLSIRNSTSHSSSQITQNEDTPFIAQYLISSFGFSEDRAIRLASHRNISPIKTPDRPESVIRFLKDIGLTDVQVKKAVSLYPRLLAKSVSRSLEPRAREIISAGFTSEVLIHLFVNMSSVLTKYNLVSRLEFWRNFVGEDVFLKYIKSRGFRHSDIDNKVIPRINLLKAYGLSNQQITYISMNSHFLTHSLDYIRSNLELLDKLRFSRESKLFSIGLMVISSMNKETFNQKVAFFKTTYGWSDEDFNLAFRKYPKIAMLSEENVSSTMDFLINKVGLAPMNIALRPEILSYSLQRRLIPRHCILDVLKSNGVDPEFHFNTICNMTEERFIEKIILPHMEEFSSSLKEELLKLCPSLKEELL